MIELLDRLARRVIAPVAGDLRAKVRAARVNQEHTAAVRVRREAAAQFLDTFLNSVRATERRDPSLD